MSLLQEKKKTVRKDTFHEEDHGMEGNARTHELMSHVTLQLETMTPEELKAFKKAVTQKIDAEIRRHGQEARDKLMAEARAQAMQYGFSRIEDFLRLPKKRNRQRIAPDDNATATSTETTAQGTSQSGEIAPGEPETDIAGNI